MIELYNLTNLPQPAVDRTSQLCRSTTYPIGSLDITRCTIVHELGHVLVARAAQGVNFASQYDPYPSEGQAAQGGETFGDRIDLYNNSNYVHSAQNIVHEIGHFINVRLGGCPASPTPSSPLGDLAAGNLRDLNGNPISYYLSPATWVRGPGFGSDGEPWEQNEASDPNEEIADMFLNWVYDVVQPVFISNQGNNFAGDTRRAFMNDRMANWIDALILNPFISCN